MNIKNTIITGIIIFLASSCSQRDVKYYYVKGYKYYEQKNYELAIGCFSKAIDIDNKAASVYFARALTLVPSSVPKCSVCGLAYGSAHSRQVNGFIYLPINDICILKEPSVSQS